MVRYTCIAQLGGREPEGDPGVHTEPARLYLQKSHFYGDPGSCIRKG